MIIFLLIFLFLFSGKGSIVFEMRCDSIALKYVEFDP